MVIRTICIPAEILEELVRVAKEKGVKEEVAGVLLGKIRDNMAVAIESEEGENILHNPSKFLIHPEELYRIIVKGEEKGLEIIGVWHTHLGDPTPSIIDVNSMMLWPVVWLIFDALTGTFTASIYDVETEKIRSVKVGLIGGKNSEIECAQKSKI